MYDVINSRYTYKGTDVLVNKLDIKDEKKLEKYERKMVAFKLATINEVEFPKVFDEKRLKFIHSYLFVMYTILQVCIDLKILLKKTLFFHSMNI